jgi:hypothetical protein
MEFGRYNYCSEDAWQDLEFRPIIMGILDHDFQECKKSFFPTFEGTYEFRDGGMGFRFTLERIDGQPVEDEVRAQWEAWSYPDIDDEPVDFDFGTEYCQGVVYFHNIGWYVDVPEKFVTDKARGILIDTQ